MNKLKYYLLGLSVVAGLSSCNDWLDVNLNPDNPTDQTSLIENQLPWFQHFYLYSTGPANFRAAATAGVLYSNNGNVNTANVTWAMAAGLTTTPYQTWFIYANSIKTAYAKAEAQNATYYMGAFNVIYALGFMEMLNLYGEMPFTEAFIPSNVSPKYDDGKTIFYGCLQKLDDAIALFGQPQPELATNFATGDYWNGGDVDKWIKLCYGLKARYLLKLSKKSDLYDPAAILDCLSKAPQSNADNILAASYNREGDVTDWLFGDYIMPNTNWDYAAYGQNQWPSKYMYDLLTNMRGAGVEDPRFTKIIPSLMYNIKLDASGSVISYDWLRSQGVDIYGAAPTRLTIGGPASLAISAYADVDKVMEYTIKDNSEKAAFTAALNGVHAYRVIEDTTVAVTYQRGSIYANSTDYHYAGDTAYVNLRSNSIGTSDSGTQGEKDVNWYYKNSTAMNAAIVGSTGSFQIRPVSDVEILTYPEMCFIKAEVLMRQGDKSGALTAYKNGIQAHINQMQSKLEEWKSVGYRNNPDMLPMDEAAITAYMSSAAVAQTAGELTMQDIMLQKYITMGVSIENWNDMRRFNFSTGNVEGFGVVYPNFDRTALFAGGAELPGVSKTDPTYWPRRWRLPATLELQYNATNAEAINKNALKEFIWSIPVWWDCATDDEYYGYIR
jgi:hypothetical protein